MRTILLAIFLSLSVIGAVKVGEKAPDFSLKGNDGKTYKLSDLKGKVVVLEWLNHGCPFVKKHYSTGNMQKIQKKLVTKGVEWVSIISSAEGKQGYSTPEEATENKKNHNSNAKMILLDAEGGVGRTYGAKTTPHMFVIDKKGLIAYMGAIDNKPSTDISDVNGARNYVLEATNAVLEGKEVAVATTKPYGCSVKY